VGRGGGVGVVVVVVVVVVEEIETGKIDGVTLGFLLEMSFCNRSNDLECSRSSFCLLLKIYNY